VQLFIGDRAFDNEHERIEFAAFGFKERFQKFRAALTVIDERPVEAHLRQAGQRAERDLFDGRLHRRGKRDGIAVATQPRVDPEDVDNGRFLGDGNGHVGTTSAEGRSVRYRCGVLGLSASIGSCGSMPLE